MRSSDELRDLVLDWLDDHYHFGDARTLVRDNEMSFLDHGVLTSLGFVELILHLEDALGVRIDPSKLTRENFDGLGKIVRYLQALP
jgi:acyl carrier protein